MPDKITSNNNFENSSPNNNSKVAFISWKTYWNIVFTLVLFAIIFLMGYCIINILPPQASLTINKIDKTSASSASTSPAPSYEKNSGIIQSPNNNTIIVNPQDQTQNTESVDLFKLTFDLFDRHFSQLLTVLSILITIFGFGLPFSSYFFQRQNLKEERLAIEKGLEKKYNEFDNKLNDYRQEISLEATKIEKTIDYLVTQKIQSSKKEISELESAIAEARQESKNDIQNSTVQLNTNINTMQEMLSKSKNDYLKFKEYLDVYSEKLKENKNYIDFSFGYFAEQLAYFAKSNHEYRQAFQYDLVAAQKFAKIGRFDRTEFLLARIKCYIDDIKNFNSVRQFNYAEIIDDLRQSCKDNEFDSMSIITDYIDSIVSSLKEAGIEIL